ncbi:enoyl-CoA hydratase-related protein [Paracoccus sp. (in: a-proteobacteria)]|uniref:enoyl-CoA hydratase-related protein n=1 Tax=Paracoccus sp. TaxID=267 RepID=UPI003A851E66
MADMPKMINFRTELTDDGILHLIFDMPGRSMNVFSNQAIHEAEAFADWLKGADLAGVVMSSGKPGAFCAGADLAELAEAYQMIAAAPPGERDALTVAHFSPIGRAFRKLETAGKPVAVALHGLALGGGCEFALAAHHRVLTDAPETVIGLPESLVGLLPGGGGTQRLPRCAGIAASLPVLLEGARLTAAQALRHGVAHQVVRPGQERSAAEAWIRSRPDPRQPWDREDWTPTDRAALHRITDPVRAAFLRRTGGHFPAEPAILDCLDRGLPVDMDSGIAAEIDIFKDLVQRVEPRNMIAAMFLGRLDHDRCKRKETLPAGLTEFGIEIRAAMLERIATLGDLGRTAATLAGIDGASPGDPEAAQAIADRCPQWFADPRNDTERAALSILSAAAKVASGWRDRIPPEQRNLADFHCATQAGFPRYLGGPFTFGATVA